MAKVIYIGGPKHGQTAKRRCKPTTGFPGPEGCKDDADMAGMRGTYHADTSIKREPLVMRWRDHKDD